MSAIYLIYTGLRLANAVRLADRLAYRQSLWRELLPHEQTCGLLINGCIRRAVILPSPHFSALDLPRSIESLKIDGNICVDWFAVDLPYLEHIDFQGESFNAEGLFTRRLVSANLHMKLTEAFEMPANNLQRGHIRLSGDWPADMSACRISWTKE